MANISWLIFNSVMLGFGLAMDAFSVSLANGFAESHMGRVRRLKVSFVYAAFQFLMPVIGWALVHRAATAFTEFERFIPWIALILLCIIGGKMTAEGINGKKAAKNLAETGLDKGSEFISNKVLLIQGIATSIDALSVGFTISDYTFYMVLVSALIIAFVTHIVCYAGLFLGSAFGTKLGSGAKMVGGFILIFIGIEIIVKSFL